MYQQYLYPEPTEHEVEMAVELLAKWRQTNQREFYSELVRMPQNAVSQAMRFLNGQ